MAMSAAKRIGSVLPRSARKAARKLLYYVRHRSLSEHDVFLASYPKSGNTWLKYMLAELMTGQDVDFRSVEHIVPHVGFHRRAPRLNNAARIIKTHEKFREEYHRAIYIVRDGRDVAVSYYYQWRKHNDGVFRSFLEKFVVGEIDYVGPWQDNVASWLQAKNRHQIEIVRYEDCLTEPLAVMSRVANFIGLNLGEARLAEAIAANSTDSMSRKERGAPSLNVRKGVAGDWLNHFADRDLDLFMGHAGHVLTELGYKV
jgi:hypothetical protein